MKLKANMRRISEFIRKQKISQQFKVWLRKWAPTPRNIESWHEKVVWKMKSQFHIIVHCKRRSWNQI